MDLAVISIESDLSTELSFDQVKGGFRGGVCVVATPPKHLNFEKLFRHGCDSYALPRENSSRRHFEGFHLTTSKAHLPEIGVRGHFSFVN